jgi:transposase
MLNLREGLSIYVSLVPMDMRKAINGLVVWVSEELNRAVQSGDLFVFVNKAKDRVKILYWDRNGFVLYHKRLERHKFYLPKLHEIKEGVLTLTSTELQGVLAGLDVLLMREFKEICYDEFI